MWHTQVHDSCLNICSPPVPTAGTACRVSAGMPEMCPCQKGNSGAGMTSCCAAAILSLPACRTTIQAEQRTGAGPAHVEGSADEVLARAHLLVNHRQQTSASAKAARVARQVGSSLSAIRQLLEERLVVAVQEGGPVVLPAMLRLQCTHELQQALQASSPAAAAAHPSSMLQLRGSWPSVAERLVTQPQGEAVDMAPLLYELRHQQQLAQGHARAPAAADQLHRLQLRVAEAACLSGNRRLAGRLLDRLAAAGEPGIAHEQNLLQLQLQADRGLDAAAAAEVWARVLPTLKAEQAPSQAQAALLLQVAAWLQKSPVRAALTEALTDSDKAAVFKRLEGSLSHLKLEQQPAQMQAQVACLQAAVQAAPESACAWMAYADWLHQRHAVAGSASMTGLFAMGEASGTAQPLPDAQLAALIQAVEAYAKALWLGRGQQQAASGMPVLLRLLELLVQLHGHMPLEAGQQQELQQAAGQAGDRSENPSSLQSQAANSAGLDPAMLSEAARFTAMRQALRKAAQQVPPLLWHALTPQLLSLLIFASQPEVQQLAQQLLTGVEALMPAVVLTPALVEQQEAARLGED